MKNFALEHPILTFLMVDETITLIHNCVAMIALGGSNRTSITHKVPEDIVSGVEELSQKIKEASKTEYNVYESKGNE